MNDLFTTAAEIAEERAGICEFDGLLTREEAERQGKLESEQWRQACEVRKALSMPLLERQEFLVDVEKKRGKKAADELRSFVQAEWFRRKAA